MMADKSKNPDQKYDPDKKKPSQAEGGRGKEELTPDLTNPDQAEGSRERIEEDIKEKLPSKKGK
jgi:hypothetical protein